MLVMRPSKFVWLSRSSTACSVTPPIEALVTSFAAGAMAGRRCHDESLLPDRFQQRANERQIVGRGHRSILGLNP